MEPLPTKFRKNDFNHEQVWRDADYAIYKRWKGDPEAYHWEVIRILKWPARELHGKSYPASEGYPSSNSWGGTAARTITKAAGIEAAHRKVEEMKTARADAIQRRGTVNDEVDEASPEMAEED